MERGRTHILCRTLAVPSNLRIWYRCLVLWWLTFGTPCLEVLAFLNQSSPTSYFSTFTTLVLQQWYHLWNPALLLWPCFIVWSYHYLRYHLSITSTQYFFVLTLQLERSHATFALRCRSKGSISSFHSIHYENLSSN